MAKRKPKNKPVALAPDTVPADPERMSHAVWLPASRTAGVVVNEDTAMTQSAVWACIRVISESLAGMPWCVGRRNEFGTIDKLPDHSLNWLLNNCPNYETEAFPFRETLWAWALGWGNGYAEIERNMRGEPVAMWQLHPCRVQPIRNHGELPTEPEYALIYEVQNEYAATSYLPARNMFHLRGPSPDGIVGWSVIRMHARSIGFAMAQEDNASSFNANDSTPGGILIHKGTLTDPARQNLVQSWERRHQGPTNRRKVAVLEGEITWQDIATSPADAQLVEQMQLTPAMIARIFRVPPHKIGASSGATGTYANVENADIEFVKDTLRPWAERGEGEADLKLIGRNNQAKLVTVIDMSERERGDTASQTAHVKDMTFCGIYDVDEGRRYLGYPPIGEKNGGTKRFVQSSMILLEDAGKPPEPQIQPPAQQPENKDATGGSLSEAATAVAEDALRRIGKREEDASHLTGDKRAEWKVKHAIYCKDALSPAVGVLAVAMNVQRATAELALSVFVESHLKSDSGWSLSDRVAQLKQSLLAAAGFGEAA